MLDSQLEQLCHVVHVLIQRDIVLAALIELAVYLLDNGHSVQLR